MKFCLVAALILSTFTLCRAQTPATKLPANDPWTKTQLLEPKVLADAIVSSKSKYVVYNIGAVEDVKTAKHIGPAQQAENLKKLRSAIAKLPKTTHVVVYCGCCPFERCPNIRPAFEALKKEGFTNARLLNLPVNLNTDWVKKGYPLAAQ